MTAHDAYDAALLVERALDDVQECLQQGKLANLADPAEVITRLNAANGWAFRPCTGPAASREGCAQRRQSRRSDAGGSGGAAQDH